MLVRTVAVIAVVTVSAADMVSGGKLPPGGGASGASGASAQQRRLDAAVERIVFNKDRTSAVIKPPENNGPSPEDRPRTAHGACSKVFPELAFGTFSTPQDAANNLNLTFTSFVLEFTDNCANDYVQVVDLGTGPSYPQLLGTNGYCNVVPPGPVQSTSNMVMVQFVSNSAVQAAGFTAEFYEICPVGQFDVVNNCDKSCFCAASTACTDAGVCPDLNNDGNPDCLSGYSGANCNTKDTSCTSCAGEEQQSNSSV